MNKLELHGKCYLDVQRTSVGSNPGTSAMIPNFPYDSFPEIPQPTVPAGEAITSMLVFFSCSTLLLPIVSSMSMTMDTATCLRTWEYRRPAHSSIKKTHRNGLLESLVS
ncbi:hypothetical protein BDR03DRAFT_564533 [Suillus americanus]|nr:hypothetical protein BDR03DRAFT_564533 [Suillus americanus]